MYIHGYALLLFKIYNFYEFFLSTKIVHAHYSSLENTNEQELKKLKLPLLHLPKITTMTPQF